jgi:hypothetical protein
MITAAHRLFQVGGFSPLSLAPALWLSDTGSNPAQWDDLSGNGRHATQATDIRQPAITPNALNGRQVRRFDGSNDFYSGNLPITNQGSIFAVFSDTESSGRNYNTVLSLGDGSGLASLLSNGSTYNYGIGRPGFENPVATLTVSASTPTILNGQWINTAVSVRRNGIENTGTLTVTPSNGTKYYIAQHFSGGYSWAGMDLAEIIVFSRTLSTTERQTLEHYLSNKYAIAI